MVGQQLSVMASTHPATQTFRWYPPSPEPALARANPTPAVLHLARLLDSLIGLFRHPPHLSDRRPLLVLYRVPGGEPSVEPISPDPAAATDGDEALSATLSQGFVIWTVIVHASWDRSAVAVGPVATGCASSVSVCAVGTWTV